MKNLTCAFALAAALQLSFFPAFSQAPNLGTAANFELFTTVGAITNTAISQITGDVGTNTGAVTGFGNVNGIMQTPPNGATAQATVDLGNALMQINSASPVNTIAPALGGGQILFAGVYHVAGVAALNGALILDAQNDPTAVFIFQLDQAFSSGFGAKVVLINGAQACNVFWRANGMINLADETSMKGNVIANNDAFSLGVHDTLEGRAFSINGAITLNSVMAFIPTGCGVPLPTGPALPIPGSAISCFTIFTKIGDVTNTGITTVTGDVGSNAGTTGGYDPLLVTGTIHPSPDGATAAAASDLTTLYNTLNLATPDITLLYPAQFGNDLVLTPHTYLMAAAASLTGNLYLNAQGLPNAVFIIQINGALTAASLSRVVLVNGTQAKNVFWLVKGAVVFGTLAVFKGSIISDGAISTATADSINGSMFTNAGAVTTQASVITGHTGGCTVLAQDWISFVGTAVKNNVQLQWQYANDISSSFFTIEKSKDGATFQTLVTVKSNGSGNYSFTDQLPYSTGYYRISNTDINNRRIYYHAIEVKSSTGTAVNVSAYINGSYIYTQTSGLSEGAGNLTVYDMEGKVISTQAIIIRSEQNIFTTVHPVQKGVYIIKISTATDVAGITRVIVL